MAATLFFCCFKIGVWRNSSPSRRNNSKSRRKTGPSWRNPFKSWRNIFKSRRNSAATYQIQRRRPPHSRRSKHSSYFFRKIFSTSSSIRLAAITPPAVFQIASFTSCTSPFFATSRFLNNGSASHSFARVLPFPSPVS